MGVLPASVGQSAKLPFVGRLGELPFVGQFAKLPFVGQFGKLPYFPGERSLSSLVGLVAEVAAAVARVFDDTAWGMAMALYVLNNPVKAGLVQRTEEWKWAYCQHP